jgi:hypothetical protein
MGVSLGVKQPVHDAGHTILSLQRLRMSGGNLYSPTRLCSKQRDGLNLLFESSRTEPFTNCSTSRTEPFTNALSTTCAAAFKCGCASWLLLSPQHSLYCRRRILKVTKTRYGWTWCVQINNIRDDEQTTYSKKRITRLNTAVLLLHCYLG